MFQHTAARRRLVDEWAMLALIHSVSTHSRPKAAGLYCTYSFDFLVVSTHSRPKAAGINNAKQKGQIYVSTHSRPKAAGH